VYYGSKAELDGLAAHLDIWEGHALEGYAVALLSGQEAASLVADGYRVETDYTLCPGMSFRMGIKNAGELGGDFKVSVTLVE
jgi:hypothetical protein